MLTIVGTGVARENKADNKLSCLNGSYQSIRSYYNCPPIKEVVSGPFLGCVRANRKRPAPEFPISRMLDDDCDAVVYILKARCLETCTWDLNLILTRLPGTMSPIPHVSHHEHCITL